MRRSRLPRPGSAARPTLVAVLATLVLLSACGGGRDQSGGPPDDSPHDEASTTSEDVASGAEAAAGAAITTVRIPMPDGTERTARLYVPADASSSGPLPLLVALHGGGGSGAQLAASTGFDALADEHGFVVVYPDGTGTRADGSLVRTWNAGVCCGRAASNEVDDVGFLRRLVTQLADELEIDPHRVFASGHSNGMMMAYRLACEASDVFVAVAGQSGTLAVPGCSPEEPVSVLHIHGDADTNVPIDGGRGEGISAVDFPSPLAGIRTVASSMGCDPDPVRTTDGPASTERWDGCDEGVEVAFTTVAGASHAWMGADASRRPGRPQPFQDFDSAAASWAFLAAHPRGS